MRYSGNMFKRFELILKAFTIIPINIYKNIYFSGLGMQHMNLLIISLLFNREL